MAHLLNGLSLSEYKELAEEFLSFVPMLTTKAQLENGMKALGVAYLNLGEHDPTIVNEAFVAYMAAGEIADDRKFLVITSSACYD